MHSNCMMKSALFFGVFIFLIISSIAQSNSDQPKLDSLMDLEFKRIMNSPIQLNGTKYESLGLLFEKAEANNYNLKNKVCFINFWFAACAPCIAELKGLNELYKKLHGTPDFRFISFTFEKQATIEKFRKEHNVAFESISLTEEECRKLILSNGYPFNLLIDQSGIINGVYSGSLGNEMESQKYFSEKILPKINQMLANLKYSNPLLDKLN